MSSSRREASRPRRWWWTGQYASCPGGERAAQVLKEALFIALDKTLARQASRH
ncbi:hypothetical protein CT19431_90004 [Cupriavidus taiwanensis]|nr:hypothetical protein CT19431_90004 [Cupriavidus taiwanensis]